MKVTAFEGVVLPTLFLFFVEVVVFDKWSYVIFFGKQIVFFTSVTRIGYAFFGIMTMQFLEGIHVLLVGGSIGGGLMNAVIGHKTVFGRNLSIKGRFELSVSHVIFLHTHKGGIRVGFAH